MAIDMNWLEEHIISRPLSDDEQAALACLEEVSVAAGEKIITEGQSGGTLEIMRSGKAKVEDNNRYEGRVTLAELEAGTLFGELTFLNNKRRTADVTAMETCIIYKLSQDSFTKLMRDQHQLAYAILAAITERQSSVIMSQRVTLAPMLRQLKEKANKLPLAIKIVPVLFLIAYIVAFFMIPEKY